MTRQRSHRHTPLAALLVFMLLAAPTADTRAGGSPTAGADPAQETGMQELSLRVDGLSCPFCAYGIEKKVGGVDNVASLDIRMEDGLVVVWPDPGTSVDPAALKKAVEEGGFTLRALTVKARGRLEELDERPVLSLPGDTLLILADDDTTAALVSEAGGVNAGKLVRVQGAVDLDHVPEGHAGHPFTLQLESFEIGAGA